MNFEAPLDQLRERPALRALLEYYQSGRGPTAGAWVDRAMTIAGITPKELARLHGLLFSNGWLDCRVSAESFLQPGKVSQCYQITNEGIRALRQVDLPGEFIPEPIANVA